VGHPLKPGHQEGHWKPVESLRKGKKAFSSLGGNLPVKYIREGIMVSFGGIKYMLNIQIYID
jgi:hypothetical protein